MGKKILTALAVLSIFNFTWANEELDLVDKCEINYSKCMEVCDSSEESTKEACYDKCDEEYSKCLEQAQSN